MSNPKAPLSPQPRHRSLARLDAEIVQTELARTRRAARIGELEAAGRNSSWARGMLDLSEQRLAQLNRSRQVLLRGEEGHHDEFRDGRPSRL